MKNIKNSLRIAFLCVKLEPRLLISPVIRMFLQTIGAVLPVYFTSVIVKQYEIGDPLLDIVKTILLFTVFFFLVDITYRIVYAVDDWARINFRAKFQNLTFKKIKEIDYEMHEKTTFLNDFTRVVDGGYRDAYNCLNALSYAVSSIFSVTALFAIFATVHYLILVFAVAMAVINIYLQRRLVKLNYNLSQMQQQNFRERGYIRRMFYLKDALEDIKTTNIDELLLEINDQVGDRVVKNCDKYASKRSFLEFLATTAMNLIYPVALGFLAYFFLEDFKMNEFVALTVAASTLVWQTRNIVNDLSWIQYAITYSDYLIKVLGQEGKIETFIGKEVIEEFSEIALEEVTFSYEPDKPVLKGININIKKGQKIALVGHNGAGKTTIVKLLLRLYDINEGKITFNGIDYQEITPRSIRNKIGIAFQNFDVYAMSIAENILLRKVDSEEDEELVVKALQFSGLDDYVKSLPEGIHTELTREFSENGAVLSKGQMQKLAIARAFASNRPLIILDEPSSALDPLSEHDIYERMMKLGKDHALIFISHRLSSTVKADWIYVIDNGVIAEQGTHTDLMKKENGIYKKMYMVQAEKYRQNGVQENA